MDSLLTERQKTEKRYHDEKHRDGAKALPTRGGSSAYTFYWGLIGDVTGLKVLDFGCGNGWLSVLLAKSGADVLGIDISGELIKKARKLAEKDGVSENAKFMEVPGENLDLPGSSFDLILGSAVLHHTDLNPAIRNIFKVLKPGGRAVFIEPMNQNIFLRLWRRATPWRRSPTERALVYDDLKFIRGVFPKARYHFLGFTSIFTEGLLLVAPGSRLARFANKLLESLDSLLLSALPFLGRYCAVVVMELHKEGGLPD